MRLKKRACNSRVEWAAHNGYVVGSNPAMPKCFNLKLQFVDDLF